MARNSGFDLPKEKNDNRDFLQEKSSLRVRAKITSPVWVAIHPVWRRCSSFPYAEYAQSSRLARQAPQHPNRGSYF
jgi:hypothetical protein